MTSEKIPRTNQELQSDLREHLCLLNNACQNFDQGIEAFALHISSTLRLLLKDGKRSTKSLLGQLGRKDFFFDTSIEHPAQMILDGKADTRRQLFIPSSGPRAFAPVFNSTRYPGGGQRLIPFTEWWEMPVLWDIMSGESLSRKTLVEHLAEQDGGVHVDAGMSPTYHRLTRQGSHGFWRSKGGPINEPFPAIITLGSPESPHRVSVRQIGHEVLITLLNEVYSYEGERFYPGTSPFAVRIHATTVAKED